MRATESTTLQCVTATNNDRHSLNFNSKSKKSRGVGSFCCLPFWNTIFGQCQVSFELALPGFTSNLIIGYRFLRPGTTLCDGALLKLSCPADWVESEPLDNLKPMQQCVIMFWHVYSRNKNFTDTNKYTGIKD